MKKKAFGLLMGGAAVSVLPQIADAEVTIINKNTIDNSLLAPLSVQVGGSIRASLKYLNGPEPDFYKNGHDGGSRFRIGSDYALSDDTSIVGYLEEGVDLAHVLELDGHYSASAGRKKQRQLYTGIKSGRFGTLTFGQQQGIYYSVIGAKSDVWLNDGHAGATIIGVNGDYDGANRPQRSVKYTKSIGAFNVYANYLLPVDEKYLSSGMKYRRNNGGGLGLDYNITPNLTLSAAYSLTDATIKNSQSQERTYHQQISGMALSWKKDGWYLAGTASYYKDFVPNKTGLTYNDYFYGDGYGVEGFVGYKFKFDQPMLKFIQPYLAADSLQLKNDVNYHANHVYFGVGADFGHGVWLYAERTLSATTDKAQDATWITLFYNF